MVTDNSIEDTIKSFKLSKKQELLLWDSLHCDFHNSWATISGNTAKDDTLWLADSICRVSPLFGFKNLDSQSENSKQLAVNLAENIISLIPLFAGRVAHRFDALRKCTNTILKASRINKHNATASAEPVSAAKA